MKAARPHPEPGRAPQGLYRTKDRRWVAISVGSDAEWSALCAAMGHPEWASNQRYAGVVARARRQDEIDEAIAAWTRQQSAAEAVQALQERGVPAGGLQARARRPRSSVAATASPAQPPAAHSDV
jgi:crotonobetainyl-CoA:carnitine CoA-transferase CaiB-like acyl-CoA transferase